MASKGPRSKLDHETRARRQKALEAPKKPQRPKAHWDHVLEEMVWLSKDFESERKWKLAQAKKVAIRASKGMLDQATRGEKRVKEEEQRLRKVAVNISKDVKKFWTKIEKLVLYKHQLELDEKKKKALDKQLEFLLGQTERYSTMLAENLVNSPTPRKSVDSYSAQKQLSIQWKGGGDDINNQTANSVSGSQSKSPDVDEDYDVHSDDESEDDEHTIEEDEALISKEEREEELAALQTEIDLPLEELLKRYAAEEVIEESSPQYIVPRAIEVKEDNSDLPGSNEARQENGVLPEATEAREVEHSPEATEARDGKKEDIVSVCKRDRGSPPAIPGRRCVESNGSLAVSNIHFSEVKIGKIRNQPKKFHNSKKKNLLDDLNDEQDDDDYVLSTGEERDFYMDDETTLLEEEEIAKAESNDTVDEIALLQRESEIPIHELLARYKKESCTDEDVDVDSESSCASASEESFASPALMNSECKQPGDQSNEFQPNTCCHAGDGIEYIGKSRDDKQSENIIADAAAVARSAQPTGNTFSTTKVRTKFPFLLKYPLREYQHIGLDWLVTMYEKRLNGILADEMGLGKTIMTIALLAHLACEKGIWGPHLIVVPTSVMLNWETEFLKWCPAFKILTYFGSAKERKIKRQGWLKPNSFHVCITTYRLVIQDSKVFKRKKWKYLILDEAHLIKNWKSQRWQTLLNFNSKRRILLTGTPLQNDLMELWSLMHFLMPHIFQSHQEFKDWFSNPISGMVEGQEKVNKEVVDRLHNVLRPFLLRRLKRDVEKQLPMKHEHVIYCRLSKRQRNLYEDFIASSETQATLASSNFFGMISVIMQLRKVCNHPDLFEGRPIVSSFDMSGIDMQLSSAVCSMLMHGPFSTVDLIGMGFVFTHLDFCMTSWESEEIQAIATPSSLIEHRASLINLGVQSSGFKHKKKPHTTNIFEEIQKALFDERLREAKEWAGSVTWWNSLRCKKKPMYSTSLRELVTVKHPVNRIQHLKCNPLSNKYSSKLADIVLSPVERFEKMVDQVESFMFAIPAARAPSPVCWCSNGGENVFIHQTYKDRCTEVLSPLLFPVRPAIVRRQVYFPDRRLIQFDCGKLQELSVLLRRLKSEGHRALIFTQMTKMLDILEAFINLYGYTYMRLDGSTQPEERQTLMQRFNTNQKIFLFILSTRSGGVGINLVGADTVIFYDSDWNPAMDQQAQDRCHRIGQTREVHIYRLISESTIEENILKKANQKRALDDLVIQSGSYNTEFFKKLDPMELFSGHQTISTKNMQKEKISQDVGDITLSSVDLEAALKNAEDEVDYMALKKVEQEEAVDNQEFTEEAIAKLEDDELVNEDDMKPDEPADHGLLNNTSDEGAAALNGSDAIEERALTFAGREDDIDMLADVKQMAAAAAAAGQEITSLENQLRPIDRYAMRFLELWDPIIDKTAVESNIHFQEAEWELDRIEKLKEDMEAEIDDDEEPFVYERWDADFATEVYRQQIEALAQHQLKEELECEAQENDALECGNSDSLRNDVSMVQKSKSKKKTKKAKFKSLKKGALASNTEVVKEKSLIEPMSIDDEIIDDEMIPSSDTDFPYPAGEKKRRPASDDDERKSTRKSKKLKKASDVSPIIHSKYPGKQQNGPKDLQLFENGVDVESKPTSKSRMGGKLKISFMPQKRVFTIKPEKLKKKGNTWSKDCFPSPDFWSSHEDATLCAVVHEYGPNWSIASEILYGMTAGGSYRGRFRHPVHCCERFRELIQKYVLSGTDVPYNDKAGNTGSGKALLKVTEDNIGMLLGLASEIHDHESLVQKHFFALLSSAWRVSSSHRSKLSTLLSQNGFYSSGQLLASTVEHISQKSLRKPLEKMKLTNLQQCGKLVEAALKSDYITQNADGASVVPPREEPLVAKEQLDITLELQGERDEAMPLPSVIRLSINGTDLSPSFKGYAGGEDHHFKSSQHMVENRFRAVAGTCVGSSVGWGSVAFPTGDARSASQTKLQYLGKHKHPVSDSTKPSKTKLRKTAVDATDVHQITVGPVLQPMAKPSADFDVWHGGVSSSCMPVVESPYFDNTCVFDLDEVAPTLDSLGMVPFDFGPNLISGIDDWSTVPEFADIG
ncbi:PHOTOPERIOD-INDEPENDENT EARLY FLOWERING 1 isoform X1 [Olea europaea subsp. europaea]|uniref:DNA helicase n=1 Tax=Olea europaea subsp. europaea TaxID=158383 RepID=A0A8S0PP29_OLEEU|nr:PHOTOPERIOD-INDEPENDENT EARLY FLOWERING 1 isoform X1 [Olea europaea subsp. europaea]